MNILIIETRKCHLEILPTWARILCGHQLTFWTYRKSKKMLIAPLLSEFNNVKQITSFFKPLTKYNHYETIKKNNFDLIILNSAETENPQITAQIIQQKTGLPVLALCHRKQTAERILQANKQHITACTLAPKLSDSQHTLYAVHYSSELTNTSPVDEGLKLVVPGMVSPDRRYYPFITEICQHLGKDDHISILGSCSSSYKSTLREILSNKQQVSHNSSAKSFPDFLNHIASSHAILSLIEPKMKRFSEYTNQLISGSVNLSIGVNKPILGNIQYLNHVGQLDETNSVGYHEHNIRGSIETLRSQYYTLEKQLKKNQLDLLNTSKVNISRLIANIT